MKRLFGYESHSPKDKKNMGEQQSRTRPEEVRRVSRRIARIETPNIQMSGPFSESEDGNYMLVRQDRDRERDIGGSRRSGNGRFALTYDGQVVFHGECERPTGGVVANTGTFAITDFLFADRTGSKLYVYSSDGKLQLSHSFSANTHSVGISPEGTHVAAQIHSGELYLFDIEQHKQISIFVPKSGGASHYMFSARERVLHLCYLNNNRQYRYSFDGTFLDADRYDRERVEDASSTELVSIVRERLDGATKEDLPTLLSLIDLSLERDLSEYRDYEALAFRLRGKIYDSLGDAEQAIDSYREALRIDPRIGVKRRLTTLEKERTSSNSDGVPAESKESEFGVVPVTATAVAEVLYNFSQRVCVSSGVQDHPLSVEHFPRVIALLASGQLTQRDYDTQPLPVQRVLYELLTQYIMFLTMNPHLKFPPDFLRESSASTLGPPCDCIHD